VKKNDGDQALVNDMTNHPGFAILEAWFAEECQQQIDSLAVYLLATSGPVDQNKIDRTRQFIKGGKWFFKQCKQSRPGTMPEDVEKGDA
jgi:galactose mutarotase-like enzyme